MRRKLWIIPIGIGAVILVAYLGGTIVKLLWNWLMPELFGLPMVTYWQALGLLALARILFGGMGRGGSHRKWSREDKERFRSRVRERWGHASPAPEQTANGPTAEL